MNIEHFSPLKKSLQRLGSWVVRQASETDVPDTTSGFRAYNREAAIQLIVVSKFTYTLETIIQAGKQLVAVDHVAIRTNPKTRESRLFPSMWSYVRRNAALDLPHLHALRAAEGLHDRRRRSSFARRVHHLGALPRTSTSSRARARATSSRSSSARCSSTRRMVLAALGHHRRPAQRELARCSSASSSACGASSCSSASRRRTTSRAPDERAAADHGRRAPASAPKSARR